VHAVDRARIEPSGATLQDLNLELALIKIMLVDARDFDLATGGGLNGSGYLNNRLVVEVQTRDSEIAPGA
jgi:hypothetical protein